MNFIDYTIEYVKKKTAKKPSRIIEVDKTALSEHIRRGIRRGLRERFAGNFADPSLDFVRGRLKEIERRRKMIDPMHWTANNNLIMATRTEADSVSSVVGTMFADECGQAQATLNAEFAAKATEDIDDLISYCRSLLLIVQPDKKV
jgi:hypothetical protein